MADDRIEIEIVLDNGEIRKGLIKTEKAAKKSGKKAGRNFSGGLVNRIKNGIKSLNGTILALGASFVAAFAGRKVIQAAAEAQQAVTNLNLALASAGTFSKEASANIIAFANGIEATTTASAESVLEMTALAQSFVTTAEEAQELTKVALDFSAGAGISFEESVRRLGRGVQGASGDIANFAPSIRNLTKDQLAAGEATRILGDRFRGLAADQTKTFSGSVAQLSNTFGKLLESIGDIVIKSPVAVGLIKSLSKTFTSLSDSINGVAKNKDLFGELILGAINFGDALNTFIVAPLELVFNASKIVFNAIKTGLQGIIAGVALAAEGYGRLAGLVGLDGPVSQGLIEFSKSSSDVFVGFANDTNKSFDDIFNFDFATKSATFLEGLRTTVDQAKEITTELTVDTNNKTAQLGTSIPPLLDQLSTNFKQFFAGVRKDGFAIGKFLAGPVSSIVKNGIARVGASLIEGGSAFKGFGKFVLGVLGDMAINVGFAISGIGKAIEALKVSLGTLSGGVAIAAGFALIALGGVLKSLSGGAGGIGAATSAGEGAGGVADTAEDTATAPLSSAELQQETKVQVNVAGDVFDTRETGLRIVELINENFDTEGTVIATA